MSKIQFPTTLDDELIEPIKILAIRQKRSVASIIEELLKGYIEKHQAAE